MTAEPGMGETVEMAAQTGLLAGRYRLEEVIGRGGMAEVYRAEDLKLGRPVAVKILLDRAGEEADRARFIAEARTLAMLSHSGLVTVLDAGFGGRASEQAVKAAAEYDQPFLVMELVDGPTLSQLMREGPMPVETVGKYAAQVADALAYVHARGVVHRDVKPGNVLIGPHDIVKLADFGIARLIEQRTHNTRSGLTIGTAAYIAPEQVRGGTVAGSADVYSLGLVLLEAITGKREYDGAPAEAALARLHRAPEIPPLPPLWQNLLTGMTALEPDDRPSAADVASELRANLGEPAPVSVVGVPDAAAAPILATGPGSEGTSTGVRTGPTVPMTDPGAGPLPAPPSPSGADSSREALTHQARRLAVRLGSLGTETRGAIAAFAALVVLLIVMAMVSGEDPAPAIPDNTPADLREPLTEMHAAVDEDGESAPALADSLDKVDAAIEAGELGEARRAVEGLTEEAAQARVEGDISDEGADRIFEAAQDVLAHLPAAAG